MTFEILGNADRDRLYCTASFSKCMTTYVCLSFLAEKYDLEAVLDDDDFMDSICGNPDARAFLTDFQRIIGSLFTLRDVCSFYNGLPYTFDLSTAQLESADRGIPFKHHCLMDESVFREFCRTLITPMDPNRCKFHYSELAIIFLGYFTEKNFQVRMEDLYRKYVMGAFSLEDSVFSRTMPAGVYAEDFSDRYDYPSIAIADHGFFCYSNGFFTTLNDQKKLLESIITTPVFGYMSDIRHARAASHRLMNGLTLEIRCVGDDVLYGYEGLSYSGCNIWTWSTRHKKGVLTFVDSEKNAYDIIYGYFGYSDFDPVPQYTEKFYNQFVRTHHYEMEKRPVPPEFTGEYRRVLINDYNLETVFTVGSHFIRIRNPEDVQYDLEYDHGIFRTVTRDHMHGIRVGFYQAESGSRYFFFDGNLYRKIR